MPEESKANIEIKIMNAIAKILGIIINLFIENVARKLHLNLVFDLGGEELLLSSPLFPFFSIFS